VLYLETIREGVNIPVGGAMAHEPGPKLLDLSRLDSKK
jgi:hypothetical protein